ncbi:NAD(P)/FAD-dependent oxidoreductase [Cellulomonas bogoriensis]|uniref:NAD(P)/FAD-dependent oxidoreductase n=1 Tax=Cellulomonas bogoriensis TaxID=301388 RepID=UPI00068BD934|nr:NAD(P)/FAD-dependent oxidoreductase [Cellulomonas bogoriensis]
MTPRHPSPDLPHVVVIGSGFGGLFATKALKDDPVKVTMLAETGHHLFQPLLYQVATGVLSPGEVAPATREILRRQRNARVLLGTVTDIDVPGRTVTSRSPAGELRLRYDNLVLAAGAGQSYFGNDEIARFAPGMKSVDDALEIRGRIFGSFELAEVTSDPRALAELLTFVVVGAGPTGVEMAGQIAELAHRSLTGSFRHIDPSRARVVLVDAVDAVLGGFAEPLGRRATERLRAMGVEVLTGHKVVGVDATGVDLENAGGTRERIPTRCTVWAAGVQASGLGRQVAEQTGAGTDRAGRVLVEPDCTLPGHPEVHVVGDMMALDDLPGVAQVAMQSAQHAADQIRRRAKGLPTGAPFRYRDKGSMATVSRFYAVAEVGRVRVSGFVAWLLWLAVHLVYLIGFKNRVTTLLHWAVSFVGRGRTERTATSQQVRARTLRMDYERMRAAGPSPSDV